MMILPRWIWPDRAKPEPTMIARTGRTVQWLLAAAAAAFLLYACLGLFVVVMVDPPEKRTDDIERVIEAMCWAVSMFFIGRGIRYVLSNE